ncbi:MAG: 2-oxo acid dehydrogenase subunit E2 [Bdellovibrionota bacterium]
MVDKAQTNKLTPGDFVDGTFTVTSLGTFAGTYATLIINYPEMGILGFTKLRLRPVVRDGKLLRVRWANIFSIDHRIVDGYLEQNSTKALLIFGKSRNCY